MKKHSGQKLLEFAVPFILDFEHLFVQVYKSIVEKIKSMDSLFHKADKSNKDWDLSMASQQKVDALEEKVQNDQDQLSSYKG